jgi:site-specific recombinase XerD
MGSDRLHQGHPIQGDELRVLRELRRQSTGAHLHVRRLKGGIASVHPHMLRHTCGHLLADAGHDTRRLQLWLGHADIKHTAHYSELSASPFKGFWK